MASIEKIVLRRKSHFTRSKILVTGSKSESNRSLILKALSDNRSKINNVSYARDTRTMIKLLESNSAVLDVLDAGTTMRFLVAYYGVTGQIKELTGTPRMKQRPIKILAEALNDLGVQISFPENQGYPPIQLHGFESQKTDVIHIKGDVSSQYISAMLMVAPILPKGLKLHLTGNIGSRPYIQMTLDLMSQFGIEYKWVDNTIQVPKQKFKRTTIDIEPDWSGSSYWYSFLALAEEGEIEIPGLKDKSLQGDRVIADIMLKLGVKTTFNPEGVLLRKTDHESEIEIDFSQCPDLAQTITVICALKNIKGIFSGLQSLKIKETDRVAALQTELAKLNSSFEHVGNGIYRLTPSNSLPAIVNISTYDDHRMAMAFAPLSMVLEVEIDDPMVVDKSYPSFWEEVSKLGIEVSKT